MTDSTIRLLEDLKKDIDDLIGEFRWAENITRTERSARGPDRNAAIHGKGGTSDPTGETVGSMRDARRQIKGAEADLRRALRKLHYSLVPVYQALHRGFRAVDRTYARTDNRIRPGGNRRLGTHRRARCQAAAGGPR